MTAKKKAVNKKIAPRGKQKSVATAAAILGRPATKTASSGNGFGFGMVTPSSVTRTLSARYYKDGSEILFSQGTKKNPRRLTPRECARLMGFPDSFRIPVSDTRAYKQFGNSVVVPVMEAVARAMQPMIHDAVLPIHDRELLAA